MSHLYSWNYLRSAVIIEFSDPCTPAPSPFILYPHILSSIVLLLKAVLMYGPTLSFRVPEVCRILISL